MYGTFNVSVTVSNPHINASVMDDVLSIVSGSLCRPPDVSITLNSSDASKPVKFKVTRAASDDARRSLYTQLCY
jgi:hypothetical protein